MLARIRALLALPIDLGAGREATLGASVGVALADTVQGYLFSRPVDAETVLAFMTGLDAGRTSAAVELATV